jgi:sugar O-acyltransferase (sialic acid O-acetyltransferase NeuD family)
MHKRPRFVIFGASEHGRVVLDAANASGQIVLRFVDDDPEQEAVYGVKVVKTTDDQWKKLTRFNFIVAVGDNVARSAIFDRLLKKGGRPVNVIHPFSSVSRYAELGTGIVLCAGVVINPGARISNDCIINTGASIDHDCIVQEHAHVCPGVRLAGGVNIGRGAMIGTGASLIPGVRVGDWAVIGAGSVVVHDIPDHVTAFGVPARIKPGGRDCGRESKAKPTTPTTKGGLLASRTNTSADSGIARL